ncbi:S-type pyocin domain-containing protein [Pseudomonas sp. MH2]|uniref:S-type pyocin domain-containing protein n=1 Tax=Pseudomonas machongensis TaxID=3110229 RepID=A0ABU5VAF1_9PSED|nr:S-type pyocin domain-containing protein [Pseudomonas sp. MH2]MEA5670336.1 S-type pyocin domain-containing protein [Pseudomonas sp. MH2]
MLEAIKKESAGKFQLNSIVPTTTDEIATLVANRYAGDDNAQIYAMEDLVIQKIDALPALDAQVQQLLGFTPSWRSTEAVMSSYEQRYGSVGDNPDLFVQRLTQSYAYSRARDFSALQIYYLSEQLKGSTTEQVRARVQARESKRHAAVLAAKAEAERIAAEAVAKAEAERTAAEAAAKAEAERTAAEAAAKAEAERTAAEAAALLANTYSTSGATAPIQAVVLTATGAVASNTATFALRSVISTAIGALGGYAATVASGFTVGVSALLYSPKLGNGELPERYSLQTPLSDLIPQANTSLPTLDATTSEAEIPYRFSSRTGAEGYSEIFAVKTDSNAIPSKVRVLSASYDAQRNIYIAVTTDSPPRTMTWTPIVNPGDPSTSLPNDLSPPTVYTGAELMPIEIRIDSYPGVADASLDDYIIVFPADSGLPPIYTMFRDRREDPGVASGQGPQVDENWSKGASIGEGAPIPMQIADSLRDRHFANWRAMREALWKAVGSDEMLSKQFSTVNVSRMRQGLAPFVPKRDRVGGRGVIELHHKILISRGGEIYNVENIFLTTPSRHIEIHKGE